MSVPYSIVVGFNNFFHHCVEFNETQILIPKYPENMSSLVFGSFQLVSCSYDNGLIVIQYVYR